MDRFGTRTLDDVLSGIAVPGTDARGVSEYVVGVLAARTRRVRWLGAAAVALVVAAGGTALALTGSEDPQEVVSSAEDSDDEESSDSDADSAETAAPGSGTVLTAVPAPTTIPVTTVPTIAGVTTPAPSFSGGSGRTPVLPPAAGPAAPPLSPSTPPTTATPDLPLTVDAIVVSSAPAGSVSMVSVNWADPDLPEGTVATARIQVDGIGGPTTATDWAVDGPCTGGTGATGTVSGALRFAASGPQRVTVEISTCGGEVNTFTADVEVPEPPGTPVLATLADGEPEAGTWSFDPDGDAPAEAVRIDPPDPDNPDPVLHNNRSIVQFLDDTPATVLILPSTAGVLQHDDLAGCVRTAGPPAAGGPWVMGDCAA